MTNASNKQLLILAWEYYGYHSRQGTALAKRPTQVAASFRRHGWNVTYVHRDALGECGDEPFALRRESNGVVRIAVRMSRPYTDEHVAGMWRKISTLLIVAFKGDRSYRWVNDVKAAHNSMELAEPNLICSFYTPRGPLALGKFFARKFRVPWIADLQDPISDGIKPALRKIASKWMARTLNSASRIFHVSPQCALEEGRLINKPVELLWHAVPLPDFNIGSYTDQNFMKPYLSCFNVFYAGSINESIQSLTPLKNVIGNLNAQGIKTIIHFAGNEGGENIFKKHFGAESIHQTGWIGQDELRKYVANCHCTLVVPAGAKKVVPSKLFEYIGLGKPVWVIGDDCVVMRALLNDWGYTNYPFSDIGFNTTIALNAFRGDASGMLSFMNCPVKPMTADELYDHYASDLNA